MAITAGVVGGKNSSGTAGTTITTTFSTKPTAGQAVAIALWTWDGTNLPATPTCADDQTGSPNTYTLLKAVTFNGGTNKITCHIFVALNVTVNAGTFVVTCTCNLSVGARIACGMSFSNVATASALDVSPGSSLASNTSTQTIGPSGTLSQADEVVLGVLNWDESPAFTTLTNSSGFTNIGVELDGATFQSGSFDYKLPNATTSLSVVYSGSPANGSDGCWAMVSLKGAGAAVVVFTKGLFIKQAVNRASTY